MKDDPRIFFSFRSPFSWLAVERLQRALPNVHEIIEFIPYWEPDDRTAQALHQRGAVIHYVQMSKAKHLYILQDTRRLAEELGLRIAWPVDIAPWWEVPHLGWLKARRLGKGAEFYAALVQARWQQRKDICDQVVVRAVAASIGLDAAAIAAAIDDPDIRTEGVECLVRAYEDDIFGVPYVRYGRDRFWGIDRLDRFLRKFISQQAGREDANADAGIAGNEPAELAAIPTELLSRSGMYDNDSAGGCG